MEGYRYFISHAANERQLAKIFYDYLVDAMGIPKSEIFCSSINEQIPFGTNDYLKYIHDALIETSKGNGKLIALISSRFMKSNFCKYEIGAAWILDVEIKPILFPPLSHGDGDIVGSPIARTQALRIEKNRINDTAFAVLSNLIIDGQRDEKIKKYVESVSREKQLSCIYNTTRAIENLLSSVDTNRVSLDMLSRTSGIYHAEGFSKTMKYEQDIDEQWVLLDIDFSSGRPPYGGFYVRPLSPNDWTPFIENKFFLRFDAYVSEGVEKLYLELKCMDYQITDKAHKMIPNTWTTYSFYLGNHNASDGWSHMKEICFVVKDDSLSTDKGIVKIKNLRLEREPIV